MRAAACRGNKVHVAGSDSRRAEQLEAAGKLMTSELRLFAGEASWMSGQLEQELGEGKWLLLSPQPQLLHDLALRPLDFGNRCAPYNIVGPYSKP